MSQAMSSSYHARGKGLPATVGHVAPAQPIRARLEIFERWAWPDGGFGPRRVIGGRATIWRERAPFHVAGAAQLH